MPRPSPKTETRCCRSARWRQDPLLHFSSATTTSFARGIKSSNPPPSSGKSRANLIPRSGRRIFHRSPGERKIAHSANILSSEDRPTFAMNDYLPCGNLKINGSLVGSMTKAPAAQSQLSDQSQPLVAPPLPRSAGLLLFYEMIPLCLERGATGTRQGGGLRAARGRSSRSDDNARPLRLAGNRTPCRRDACRRRESEALRQPRKDGAGDRFHCILAPWDRARTCCAGHATPRFSLTGKELHCIGHHPLLIHIKRSHLSRRTRWRVIMRGQSPI